MCYSLINRKLNVCHEMVDMVKFKKEYYGGEYILKKRNLFIFMLIFLFLFCSSLPLGNYKARAETSKVIRLGFVPVDSVIDPGRPIIYAVSSNSKSVYSINYETGEIKRADFSLQPERIALANDKIYVTLLKMQHEYYTGDPLVGAIGIIDASTFSTPSQFDIDMDPYDIEADGSGNIYITPGSNQWGNVEVFSSNTKTKIGEAGFTYMSSLIQLNPVSSKLYLITTSVSPRDMEAYGFSQNTFKRLYDSQYHGDYELNTNMRISPDGRFIFNGSGNIFNCTNLQSTDMTYVGKLSSPFTDVCFSSSKIYAGLSNGNIAVYNYSNFACIGYVAASGNVVNLYYRNGSLISLSKLMDNTFGVEVIRVEGSQPPSGGNSEQLIITSVFPEQGNSNVSINGYIIFRFSQNVNIDYNKDILGDCTIRNYIENKAAAGNQLELYYDNLSFNTKYNIKLNAAALIDDNGNPFTGDYYLEFTTGPEFCRLSGPTRYETSVEISKFGSPYGPYIVLATGEDFPDALCATPLATKYEAPILLTNKNSLPAAAENEIDRLKPKEAFLIGDADVISGNVENVLRSKGINTTRISGRTRYETSLEIAEFLNSPAQEAFVVTGADYPDALSIASYAANKHIPILLTEKDKVPDGIKNYITSKGITKTYVVGGTGVISDSVLNSLPNAERIAGNNRYETNFEVLSRFNFFYGEVYFATGQDFPDALSGAAIAGAGNNPVILADDSMPDNIVGLLNQNKDLMKKMKRILGGSDVVSDSIINRIFR
jgi:Putative cell wall-binding domain